MLWELTGELAHWSCSAGSNSLIFGERGVSNDKLKVLLVFLDSGVNIALFQVGSSNGVRMMFVFFFFVFADDGGEGMEGGILTLILW